MDFSESWKSTWPVSAVFPAPNLLSGPSAKALGPLLFGPSSPPRTLFSSSSLALCVPPALRPSSLRKGLRTFFRDPEEGFVPSAVQADLVAAVLPESGGSADVDPVFANQLQVLRCRDGDGFVLFFPTGDNSNEVGYLGLSLKGAKPEIRADVGDVFRQKEGLAHPHHRITSMSVVSVDPPDADWNVPANPLAEGYLLVTTLYSVTWFRVEIGAPRSGLDQQRPLLVPIGRKPFASRVVHACWNPHFEEESVVLLENGELYWIKLNLKRGVRINAPEGDSGRWLSCQFGGLPWTLFVASSRMVVMVDLRSRNGSKRTALAKIEEPDSYIIVHSMEKDQFIAFCRADFDGYRFSVVTEHHLLLFDTRQPLVPILKWDHGLNCPCYVAMYKLSELRPSTEFKWASESGFSILVGSFQSSEFSLFCCGPKIKGDPYNPVLYAWELPSDPCLSGWQCNSADALLKEVVSKEELPGKTECWQKETVVGFFILPESSFSMPSNSENTDGFILLRLLSFGKLEWQQYFASWKPFLREQSCKLKASLEIQPLLFQDCEDKLTTRHDYLKLNFLSAYLSGNLSNAMRSEIHNPDLNHIEPGQIYDNRELLEYIDKELCRSSPSVSNYLSDVSIPASIYELASQRALYSLPSSLLRLAFSRYSELFPNPKDSSFEFLEVCGSLPYKELPSFYIRKPSGRSEKWSHKAIPTDSLVGPVLPLSVLLTLQQIEEDKQVICLDEKFNGDDLLDHQCRMILEKVFPEISIAAANEPTQELQDEKPFFIHEPRSCASGNPIYHKTCSTVVQQKEGHNLHHLQSSEIAINDDRFSIFVSGIQDMPDCRSSIQVAETSEMFDDLAPMRLDIDSSVTGFSHGEHKIFRSLKRQFSKWLNVEDCRDLHISSKIPRRVL